MDTDLWFAPPKQKRRRAQALAICAECPVQPECLDAAMRWEAGSALRWGIFGGVPPEDRAAMDPTVTGVADAAA